jgi:hypothetical protein
LTAHISFSDHYLAFLPAKARQLISVESHSTLKAEGIPISERRILAALLDGPRSVTDVGLPLVALMRAAQTHGDRLFALALQHQHQQDGAGKPLT